MEDIYQTQAWEDTDYYAIMNDISSHEEIVEELCRFIHANGLEDRWREWVESKVENENNGGQK